MSPSRDPERLAALDALFDAALEVEPGERAAWLDRRCAGDESLRLQIEELLRLAGEPAAALDSPGGGEALLAELGESLAGRGELCAGRRVGLWRLLREIGEGGMGTVYLAERADGEFEQRVALKVLSTRIEAATAVQRFEQERQILASFEHPHIARLLDGGRTEGGRPYLVMEYVEGRPIDLYCREAGLGLEERLELFAQVGEAVQYAHQKLVVHRDLKPANILVTATGAVKLLDFGIAKPMVESGMGLTRTAARVLTPEYGSPEQVRGMPVSAASDVYQLGLLLYELLTGCRAQRFDDTTPAAIEQGICEREPKRPSTAVRLGEGDSDSLPAASKGLAKRLRGDLDTIVLKALRKEPERRYQSVAALLDDLERYKERRPIRARPDTFGYRAGKFVGRHRLALAAGTTVVLMVAALTLFYTARLRAERDRVRVEAEKSRASLEFLLGTFSPLDPMLTERQADVTARVLLARAVVTARRDLGDQPLVRAALLDSFGRTYRNLGLYAESEDAISEALAIRRQLLPSGHRDIALSLVNLARALQGSTQLKPARARAREALELFRASGESGLELGSAVMVLASILSSSGQFEEAQPHYEEAIALFAGSLPAAQQQLLRAQNDYATYYFDLGDYARAVEVYGDVARACRALPAEEATALPWALGGEGAALTALGRLQEGETRLREALEIMDRRFDGDHPEFADYERLLATNLTKQGRLAEAEVHYRNTLERYRRVLGPRHHEVAKSLYDLAALLRTQERFSEARQAIGDCLDILGDFLPPTHPHMGRATAGAAWIELESGAPALAVERFDEALTILGASLAPGHSLVLETRTGRGSALMALGRKSEACAEWRELSALAAASQVADEAKERLSGLLAQCG